MKKIGITGNIGSGKSTVSDIIKKLGYKVFESDQEVSKLLINDAQVALSGGKFFGSSGEGWFRINCGHPRSKLIIAVDRICNTFKS